MKSQLVTIQTAIDNVLNAIQAGIFTESTKQRLEELEQSKKILQDSIAVEKLRKPILKPDNLRKWFHKLRTFIIFIVRMFSEKIIKPNSRSFRSWV